MEKIKVASISQQTLITKQIAHVKPDRNQQQKPAQFAKQTCKQEILTFFGFNQTPNSHHTSGPDRALRNYMVCSLVAFSMPEKCALALHAHERLAL